ncbi:MAG: hypothetical protein M1835_008165 [Candelina submexicana]|nr:MAG: hypothetical protein M1835_008165 [Candelina submexicana]
MPTLCLVRDRMINGQMVEAQKGFALLEEVDRDTLKVTSRISSVSSSKGECETTDWTQEPPADDPFAAESIAELVHPTETPIGWGWGNFK